MAAPIINFSGLASGIDSASLIKALLDRERAARVEPLQTKITQFEDANDAFSELTDLLTKLQTASSKFREVYGGILSKLGGSSDETVATATSTNYATNGNYNVTVSQLAKNATYSFASSGATYSSSDQAINSNIGNSDPNRTVTVEIGSGTDLETVEIELTNTTTLSDFVTQFNASSTKAAASLVNVGSAAAPDYRIAINSNSSGLSKGQISVTVGSEITDPDGNPLTTDGAFDSNSLSQAMDAEFSIAGIGAITRSTNTVSDVISGVTFNLKGIGSAAISVGDDPDTTTSMMQDFVDAYNEIVTFISENDLISREEEGDDVTNVFGPLAGTSLDDNIASALRSALSGAGISGQSVNTLADLGITTERDGTLKFDETIFQSALNSDPESVRTITQKLGETLASTTGTIAQFTQFNGLIDQAENNNKEQISSLEKRVAEIENSLAKQEEMMTARFGRLEALISQLNAQQSALVSLLPS